MDDIAIRVENLGKLYHIGEHQPYKTLSDAITNLFTAGMRRLKQNFKSKDKTPNYIWALKDVSFEIKRGEVVGVIGRNGAGKTTLLKILSRITPPTEGYAEVRGRVGSLLEVGTGFHPELTGRDNIYLNGAILGMRKQEINRKFDEIVAFAELEKFIDTPVKYYSSGMYVRLAFAVAAHLEPEILLVDEVLSVGDSQFQKKCLGKMGDVSKEGRTVLFVSHNMAAVNRLCQKAIWIDGGWLRMIGTTDNVVSVYLSTGTAIQGQRIWEDRKRAPWNEKIWLRSVRILNPEGQVSSALDYRRHFYVEISYEIFSPLSNMQVGFWILTSDGIVVFGAGDRENSQWLEKVRTPGKYISRCKVPGMFLNSGMYMINATVNFLGDGTVIMEENALGFYIEQTEAPLHSSQATWRPPGVLCLSLEWEISKTGE